jgi:membrane protein DedA with SNARE-associated domain
LFVDRHLFDWLVRYGTPLLFLAQLFGIFGLPIPDELLLTIAGALVRRGQLHGAPTIIAALTGCMAGITLSYVLGRTIGLATLQRVMHLHQDALARAQTFFRRFGCWLLAFGYFIPGVRHVTALAAGSTPLEYATFAKFAYPGAALWCAVFVGLGYFAGDRSEQVLGIIRGHLVVVALAATAVGVSYALWTARRTVPIQ